MLSSIVLTDPKLTRIKGSPVEEQAQGKISTKYAFGVEETLRDFSQSCAHMTDRSAFERVSVCFVSPTVRDSSNVFRHS